MFNKKLFAGATVLATVAAVKSFGKKNPIETMDELTTLFSKSCDDIILKTLKEDKSLTYVSGLFKVKLDEQKQHVLINADLYFQNEAGDWIKKENGRELLIKEVGAAILQELQQIEEVVFEIEAPKQFQQKEE